MGVRELPQADWTHVTRPEPVPVEELLKNSAWVTTLARQLVGPDRVQDLVQETWLAALKKPPRDPSALGGWLTQVIRNLSSRSHRSEYRRAKHEQSWRRQQPRESDGSQTDPAWVVERAEQHRVVVEAVMRLEEPYRSTLLLYYFEDLSPAELSRLLGVPSSTVWTRIQRGLDQLRRDLGSSGPEWRSGLALLAIPLRELDGLGVLSATSAAPAAAPSTLALVIPNSTWLLTAAATVGLVVGVVTGTQSQPSGAYPAGSPAQARAERIETPDALAELEDRASELDALLTERALRIEQLEGQHRALIAKLAEPLEVRGEIPNPRSAELQRRLDAADWPKLASLVQRATRILIATAEKYEATREVDLPLEAIAVNQEVVNFVIPFAGEFPTHTTINGEFTHPEFVTRLARAYLDLEGVPCSADQLDTIDERLLDYHREEQAAVREEVARRGEGLELRALERELARKIDFQTELLELLRPDQQRVLKPRATADLLGYDFFSPGLLFTGSLVSIQGDSLDEIEAGFAKRIRHSYRLEPRVDLRRLSQDWRFAIAETATKTGLAQISLPLWAIESALAEQCATFETLLEFDLDPESRESIREESRLFFPLLNLDP